jgi:hypothetical protein
VLFFTVSFKQVKKSFAKNTLTASVALLTPTASGDILQRRGWVGFRARE